MDTAEKFWKHFSRRGYFWRLNVAFLGLWYLLKWNIFFDGSHLKLGGKYFQSKITPLRMYLVPLEDSPDLRALQKKGLLKKVGIFTPQSGKNLLSVEWGFSFSSKLLLIRKLKNNFEPVAYPASISMSHNDMYRYILFFHSN